MHFHGSDFGKCKRAIYYDMHKKRNKDIENGRESLFLNMGHRFEEIIATSLKRCGEYKRVICNDGSDDKALEVYNIKEVYLQDGSEHITIEVEVFGHFDILIDDILLEIKAVGKSSFNSVFVKADLSQRKQYYGQVQFYLDCLPDIKHGFLVGILRETCEIAPPIKIDRDLKFLNKVYEDYAKVLYFGLVKKQLPSRDHENLSDYECRWCNYYTFCSNNENVHNFEV